MRDLSVRKYIYIIIIVLLGYLLSCEPFATQFEDLEDGIFYYSNRIETPPANADELKIMTWNIRFGIGRILWFGDSCGDRVIMSQDEVYPNLRKIADVINETKPDIILLQEVDLNSKKSAYINQLQYLLDNTYFNYGVFAYTWKSPFVPSDGLGRIHEGNAIISRWKITQGTRIKLPRREDQDALTHYFYVQPCILKAKISLPQKENFYIFNTHLSAFATDDSKKKQIDVLMTELNRANSGGDHFVLGGDFNLIPPNSDSTDFCIEDICSGESFHQPGDDPLHKDGSNYTPEITWIQPIYNSYIPAVSLADYGNNQSNYFTHTTRIDTDWDRKLDYLFTNINWKIGSEVTHKNVITISDHAAVSAIVEVP